MTPLSLDLIIKQLLTETAAFYFQSEDFISFFLESVILLEVLVPYCITSVWVHYSNYGTMVALCTSENLVSPIVV